MNVLNEILLRRKNQLVLENANPTYEQTDGEKAMVGAILKNVQSLGFTFARDVLEILFHYNREELESFYRDLIPELKKLVGADVQYNPMYPNFPQQVMEMSDVELFINAIVHYWSFGTLLPQYEKQERLPLIDDNKMTVLSTKNCKNVGEILQNLLKSPTNLSENDRKDIATCIKNMPNYAEFLPDEIPLKENVAFLGKLIIEETPIKSSRSIEKYFKTATDVLRLITALSDGDISLATKTQYRNLRRAERRIVMDLLANCGNILEDLYRYKFEWLYIGKMLHVGEYWYMKKYNNVRGAFYTFRNEKKPMFMAGKVQAAILKNDMLEAAKMLKSRPGDFARQLDKLLRDSDEKHIAYITAAFAEVAEKVSTPVLLQVREHFIERKGEKMPVRVFFPKGNVAKAMVIPNDLPAISVTACQQIVDTCNKALVAQFKTKEPMGKVYINPDFKNYLVPFSQRSASSANKIVVRGSKLPINPKAKAVRGFIWWTNMKPTDIYGDDRVDIDLSAAIYDENWNYVEHVSYTNLRSHRYNACHSGDITNGGSANGDGVAEFLDVDIDSVARNAGRYIVYQVYSFTRQKFSEMPNCRFGWMEREDVNSGEIFEPKTVEMKIDLTSESDVAIPVIFDCVERKFIWCDMSLRIAQTRWGGNNLESNLKGTTATCYALTHFNKPNLYELIYLNAFARGEITNDRNAADIIFDNDKTIPYEVVETVDEVTGLPSRTLRDKTEVQIIDSYNFDYIVGELL
jgi:hypothetical protein